MSNKRIQISDDAGATNWTLPGNTGDQKNNLTLVDDTVFGQNYMSQNPVLGDWNVTANGLFKGVSGYNAVLKKPGTATTMTGEATTLVSTRVYQITNAVKRVLSYLDALTVLDGVTDVTVQVLSIDYLTGTVTFVGTYTVVGAVTVTGKYIPLAVMAKAKGFQLQLTNTPIDTSCYDDAQSNGGWRTTTAGLKKVQLTVDLIFAASNAWLATLIARGIAYIEIDLEATNPGRTVARGFFKVSSRNQSGKQGALELEQVVFELWVPDGALVVTPFNWYITTASTLSKAIQKTLTGWLTDTAVTVTYLPTGATGASPVDGIRGLAIVDQCNLANLVEGQNEYTFSYKGSGAATPI